MRPEVTRLKCLITAEKNLPKLKGFSLLFTFLSCASTTETLSGHKVADR